MPQQPSLREELEGLHLDQPGWESQMSPQLRRWVASDEGESVREQVRESDLKMARELQSVATPAGLKQRLLESLQRERDDRPADPAEGSGVEKQVGLASQVNPPGDATRSKRIRWPISIALSVAGMLVVSVVMAVVFWPAPVAVTPDIIAHKSMRWASGLTDQTWYDMSPEVLRDAPLPDDVAATPVRWTQLSTEWDDQTVLYDLAGPEGRTAMLFVVSLDSGSRLAERFPPDPDYVTGSLSVASSYRRGRLYILMVEGDVERYRSFLQPMWPFG